MVLPPLPRRSVVWNNAVVVTVDTATLCSQQKSMEADGLLLDNIVQEAPQVTYTVLFNNTSSS
jgi:hypothetical protein